MRLLIRPRPEVHILNVVVPALEGERPGLGPGAHDQVVRLVEAVVRESRIHPESVVLGADAAHEPGNQPAARDHVDHRVLLGDHERMLAQRQRAPQDRDFRALRAARERGSRDDGRRHEAVRGLVVLVDRDRVESQLLAVLQLVEITVVEPVAFHRVEIRIRQIDPHRAVLAPGVEVEVGIGHQVKQNHFHGITPFPRIA